MNDLNTLYIALGVLLGLLIGSFLNVVVYRWPKMLENDWAASGEEYLACKTAQINTSGEPNTAVIDASTKDKDKFNLLFPASTCPHCQHKIRWFENIPIFSYLFLKGQCSQCHAKIGARYPLVEMTTGLLFAYCIHRWGWTPTGWAWCGFSAALLCASLIDWDTMYLPDDITLPLMWAGLLAAAWKITPITLFDAVNSAALAYSFLWLLYWFFKLTTGKEGMGHGDFKLFAVFGAWLGWESLLPILLISSLSGIVFFLLMNARSKLKNEQPFCFGPFLAIGAAVVVVVDAHVVMQWITLSTK